MKIAGLDLSISSSGVIVEDLDENLNVEDVKCFGFTTKKKLESDNIIYYNTKNFNSEYERYMFCIKHILDWIKDCEYVSVEDYGFASTGMVFNLAEFEGFIKISLYNSGKKLRFYAINSIKKFFTGNGLSDKISMYQEFTKRDCKKPDISYLPECENGHGMQTTSDIIDAFAICEFLRKELRIKNGIELLKDQNKKIIECFNTITKSMPEGLLTKNFISKDDVQF
jgi:hypothetical protein